MRTLMFGLLWAVLPATGQPAGAPIAPIELYTQFQPQQQPPAEILEAVRNEVETIMAPTGLHFEWRAIAGVRGDEVSVELAVITFKGRCNLDGLPQSEGGYMGALGWTHVSDGVILPFTDIDCDGIRRFLRHGLMQVNPKSRSMAYGRAIARVLTHELYHIFADTKRHASEGVGKPAYTARELLEEDFRFGEIEAHALRTSKIHTVLENAAAGDSSR